MARARNIKPSIFRNELLGTLDPLVTILFTSLWCLADRDGKLEDRPLRIKADTFPYRENVDINRYLTELAHFGFIRRYSINGLAVIQVIKFKEHQSPHKTERDSVLPDYELQAVENKQEYILTDVVPLNNDGLTAALPPESIFLNPDLLNPSSLIPDCGIMNPSISNAPPAGLALVVKKPAVKKELPPTAETWSAYANAYLDRYKTLPVRNMTVNSQLSGVVKRLGVEEAPLVAAWYVGSQNQFYVNAGHSVGMLLRDCEKLRTQWATGRHVTVTQAMQADKTQTNLSAFAGMIDEAKEKQNGVR
jgi:hypothetical protein